MSTLRAVRWAHGYLRDRPAREEEVRVRTPLGEREATLHLPRGPRPHTAWIVLHGITARGRRHPALLR
ncbi:MAG: hypothetical protein M3409_07735, partial [Gemmatimonadota bacterium]|nr:hypothetical protein [Gemmatimonadota bacterium]